MAGRDPARGLDNDAFADHFNWISRHGGPLISFFADWDSALAWRQMFLDQGPQRVLVIALWLKDLEIYDVYGIASR